MVQNHPWSLHYLWLKLVSSQDSSRSFNSLELDQSSPYTSSSRLSLSRLLLLSQVATAIRSIISPLIFISTLTKERTVSGVTKTKLKIPSRDKGRFIKVNIYRPKDVPQDEILPVHINMHGSGFVLRMHGTDQGWCSYLSKRMKLVVVDADYSKAPEHPYPRPVQDVEGEKMMIGH